MRAAQIINRVTALACCVAVATVGCGFRGINSLPLPGTVGTGPTALLYHLQVANIGTLEANSPVMVENVVVGSVRQMRFNDWHVDVDVTVRPGTRVPANAVATVGQTSLLGSMHVALDPPLGSAPVGVLEPNSTIPLSATSSYPSTERTLASLSALVNGGGLGQIGDIVHGVNTALSGREPQVRELLGRLEEFVDLFDQQRGDVIESLKALDRLSGQLATQREVMSSALRSLPAALDVLIQQRPTFTSALEKLSRLGDTARTLVDASQADLVADLEKLAPTLKALADVGPEIAAVLGYLPTAPFSQNIVDRGVRGDYMNLFVILDFTTARLKRTLLAGTRFEDQNAQLVPAPGDIGYDAYYTRNPLGAPISPPPATWEEALKIAPPPQPGGGG
ncbi:MCE family protein [Mycobacterium sp. UM_Kg1]|uniref:MCE family protein n=1 Tax=Mycobacterium sp. UM_Kg1 TaxID=1545691 RepID=UPI00061B421D|nr:MCE family protein [Mycobacterium sp. UM_Kg1]